MIMDEGNGLSAEIEEILKELWPDHVAADFGRPGRNNGNNLIRGNTYRMERGVNLPSVSLYNSNQQSMVMNLAKNHQVAATTSNINPGIWQHSRRTSESTSWLTNSIDWVNPTLLESAPRVELNSTDWVNPTFHKILLMKQKYLSQAITILNGAREGRHRATNAELAIRHERTRIHAEKIIRFLSMSKTDLLQWRKEEIHEAMNDIIKNLDRVKQSKQVVASFNSTPANSSMQGGCSSMPQSFVVNSFNSSWYSPMRSSQQQGSPLGNVTSSPRKGPQMEFDQNALGMLLRSNGVSCHNNLTTSSPQQRVAVLRNIFNSLDYSSKNSLVARSSGAARPTQQILPQKNKQQMMQKRKEDTKPRCFNQKQSPQKSSSSSISSQYSQEYSSQLEEKDLSLVIAKSGRPLIPLTPLTPTSAPENSGKIPSPTPAQIPLQEKNQNQIPSQEKNKNQNVPDTLVKSCLHEESNDKHPPIIKPDPMKYLIEVVKSISSTALKDALRDMYAVTNVTDRIAGHFLDGESNKVGFQDLADDIITDCDYGVKSRLKRQLDSLTTLNYTTTEIEFCGSAKIKRVKKEPNDLLLDEIREINQKLIEVVVDVKDVSITGYNKRTLIRCSYIPTGFLGNITSPNTSRQMLAQFPSLILELIVADDYPNSSPTILETMPSCYSDGEDGRYLWIKANSKMSSSIRKYSDPISLREIAESWDVCCRELFHELAEQVGVGSVFSSRYGKWETCIVAS